MSKLPSMEENPLGLHHRYALQKIKSNPNYDPNGDYMHQRNPFILVPPEEDEQYFVLRLDAGQKDKAHLDACRKALAVYADAIRDTNHLLAENIISHYGL